MKNKGAIDRILLVGYGSIGKRHLKNIRRLLPNAAVMVLRSRENTESISGCEVVHNMEMALELQPQIAFICTPASYHLDAASVLARNGSHLFIEKPLSSTLDGIGEFMEVVRDSRVKVMVGYNLRFSKSLLKFRETIERKEYGRSLFVAAEVGQYLPDWRPGVDYQTTVSAQSKFGGGALLELSHELDYLIWLFGDAESVSGRLLKVSDLAIDVEDLVLAHVCFKKNGIGLHGSIQLDFLQRRPYRVCKVVCEEATIIWDAVADCVEVHRQNRVTVVFQGDRDRNYMYEEEVRQFVSCIEEGGQVPIRLEDGLKVLDLVAGVKASSTSGKVVQL